MANVSSTPPGRAPKSRTEDRAAAEAYLAQLKLAAYKEAHSGIKPKRSWQEAVPRYLALKANLRRIEDVRRICRKLDPYLGPLNPDEITGDVVRTIVQGENEKGQHARDNQPLSGPDSRPSSDGPR